MRKLYYSILNHTELYEYKHGKMLMHLNFCFEGIPDRQSPATTLKYYRLRKGLTTRQLAESVGIVPATVLLYEREQFPIPYQKAVATADILEIDKNLLFDDFPLFLDAPYYKILRKVRNIYRLNQTEFAEKAEICFSIYAKWESGSRQPSRKMYQKLVSAFPNFIYTFDFFCLYRYIIVQGKGNRQRVVPMGLDTRKYMLKYDTLTKKLERKNFFMKKDNTPITENTIKQLFTRLKRITGIQRIRPHLLRHTFATKFLENGGDVFTLQQLLGHTTLDMSRKYLHLNTSNILEKYKQFSPLDNAKKAPKK